MGSLAVIQYSDNMATMKRPSEDALLGAPKRCRYGLLYYLLYELKQVTQKIVGVADIIMHWLDRGLVYMPDDADRVFNKLSYRWKFVYSKHYSRRWKIPVTVNTLDSESCVVYVKDGADLWDLNLAVRECMPIPCNANLNFYANENELDYDYNRKFFEPCTLTMLVCASGSQ